MAPAGPLRRASSCPELRGAATAAGPDAGDGGSGEGADVDGDTPPPG